MARFGQKFEKRLQQLETKLTPAAKVSGLLFTWFRVPEEQLANLGLGERVVTDHYRHTGMLIEGRERISSDPKDCGRRCEPDGYLEDIVREIHQDCWFRDKSGFCGHCIHTPVAGT